MRFKYCESHTWIAGSRGMVGAALARRLPKAIPDPSRENLDLRCKVDVEKFIFKNRPEIIFLAAARVGGILANMTSPADFIADNLQIQTNVITAAAELGVKRLVFFGSSCIYPKDAPQPMREQDLMSGPLEETNRAYAMAKLAGIELVRAMRRQYGLDYISLLPCNLYGPGDTYDARTSHVIPALMLKFREALETCAKSVTIWGTGAPLREFMHVDDLADAALHLAGCYRDVEPVNVGTGREIGIKNLAHMLGEIAGFKGTIVYDGSKPDGVPRKLLDVTRLSATSWMPRIELRQGLEQVWTHFLRAPAACRPSSKVSTKRRA
ncbi:MAG: GDP-L-fucose synthase [Rhodospirillales bacterium]|nr:GDP-L-fucose synthase [Alphaproteobacteria bacterium]MCB9986032.1 GDP-L-fucose synthase [Rhodospirillales bacterium]USO07395.1 MAG: GDP-L-fucose synthase [Rhodospirillales bacterium]